MPWYGFSLPSMGFEMSMTRGPKTGLWALTAMAPELEPMDFYGLPDHTIHLKVQQGKRTIFSGRATYALFLLDRAVEVRHGEKYPFAALLPGADGLTTFVSDAPARPEDGGYLAVKSETPARPALDVEQDEWGMPLEAAHRQPMVDVLGPRIEFSAGKGTKADIYAGQHRITGLRPDRSFSVTLKVPYSARLIPQPVDQEWGDQLPESFSMLQEEASTDEDREATERGPRYQGRWISAYELPKSTLKLDYLDVPDAQTWARFARTTRNHGSVPAFLKNGPYDFMETVYELPPVLDKRSVAVFGRITKLRTDSFRGDIVVGGESRSLVRGQKLSTSGGKGLDAGRDSLVPIASVGEETPTFDLEGRTTSRVDGTVITKIPYGGWLIALLIATIAGLAIERLVKWAAKSFRTGSE